MSTSGPRPAPDPDPTFAAGGHSSSPVPIHIHSLYAAAAANCDESQSQELAALMTEFADVFSAGDFDTGRTELVHHGIPVIPGTRPIRQPPHRLGPEKEAEAERQVNSLLKKGLIEEADGAWSSPVVLLQWDLVSRS